MYGHILVNVPQITGSYYATVLDSDVTNHAVAKGNMRVIIPSINPTDVWDDIPYHGAFPPPDGSTVTVAFQAASTNPIHTSSIGVTNEQLLYGTTVPTASQGNNGDIYIDTATSTIYGPKTPTGWGSGTPFMGSGGSQGPQGYQGAQGTTGAQGGTGAQGSTGSQGPQGFQGTAGANGAQGYQGSTGIGTQGSQGYQGNAGTAGTQGYQGYQGQIGVGTQGSQGYQGSAGTNGTNGTQGNQGYQGVAGTNGTNGAQGAQGATGSQGNQGYQGNQGSIGTQGNQGSQGVYTSNGTAPTDTTLLWLDTSATGNGTQGPQGAQGASGSQLTAMNGTLPPAFWSTSTTLTSLAGPTYMSASIDTIVAGSAGTVAGGGNAWSTPLLKGTVRTTAVYLVAGTVISKLWLPVTTAGSSATCYMGLYNATTQLAVTSSFTANATGWSIGTLTSSYTIPTTGIYYVAILATNTSTTSPSVLFVSSFSSAFAAGSVFQPAPTSGNLAGQSPFFGSALNTLPSTVSGTVSLDSLAFLVGLS